MSTFTGIKAVEPKLSNKENMSEQLNRNSSKTIQSR